ncbi:hypothetical protein M3Y95_00548400 [Aphelenchoides besseyi]|nr:hypothetical protein M3Y95_00548400 [Aphelenchoides besseyi]
MIVEHSPTFISLEPDEHSFLFDKNGRFIYACRDDWQEIPVIIVYDIILNTYIELVADSSIRNLECDKKKLAFNNIPTILPVDTKLLLFVTAKWYPRTVMLLLMRLDFEHKTYGIVDQHLFVHSYHPDLVSDEKMFGLFCKSICQHGRMQNVEEQQVELELYTFHELLIESEKIKVGRQKEIQYKVYRQPEPRRLHLRCNKLWFTRDKKLQRSTIYSAQRLGLPPPSPTERYVHISYFDLNEEKPVERTVDFIKEENYCVHWARDLMLLQVHNTKFVWFDLTEGKFLETESNITQREWKSFFRFETECNHYFCCNLKEHF